MSSPSGTVTFLFTDIEGSTRLWESSVGEMRDALALHDEIMRVAIHGGGGHVFATGGDGFAVAFQRAGDAVAAAIDPQRRLAAGKWPSSAPIRVRMGLHSGEADERDGDYFGTAVNRAARLTAIAHGGQVVCSQATASLLATDGHLSCAAWESTVSAISGPRRWCTRSVRGASHHCDQLMQCRRTCLRSGRS